MILQGGPLNEFLFYVLFLERRDLRFKILNKKYVIKFKVVEFWIGFLK